MLNAKSTLFMPDGQSWRLNEREFDAPDAKAQGIV
jgi:hypothetical protein